MSSSRSLGSRLSVVDQLAVGREHLVGVAHRLEAQHAVDRTDRDEGLLRAQHEPTDRDLASSSSITSTSSRYGLGRVLVGDEVVGLLEVDGVDLGRGRRSPRSRSWRLALGLSAAELVALDDHVLTALELVALHDLVVRDLFAGLLRDPPVPDAGAGLRLELVEAHVLRARRRHQPHGHRHESEADRSGPDGAGQGGPPRSPVAYYLRRSWHLRSNKRSRSVPAEPEPSPRRGRGPAPAGHQPRQGLVPRDRLHQRPGRRLLRPDRPGAAAPPRTTGRSRWSGCPTGSTASGSSRSAARATGPPGSDTVPLDADSDDRRLRRRRACRRWCGWPTWPRSSCTRPRPGPPTRGQPTAIVFDLDPGARHRPRSTARASPSSSTSSSDQLGLPAVVEDVGREGPAPLGGHPSVGRRRDRPRASHSRSASVLESRDPKRVTVTMAQGPARRARLRRLEPERPPQDDGVRLLAPRHRHPGVSTPVAWDELHELDGG